MTTFVKRCWSAVDCAAHRRAADLEPALVYLAVASLLAVAVPSLQHSHQATTGDGGDYVAMARHVGLFPEAPEGFRILTPWLVSVLPGDVQVGFFIVTVACLALAAMLLFVWLRDVYERVAAYWGVALFLASGAVVNAARNPYLVDPMAFAFVMAAFLLLFRRRWIALGLVLGLGVLAKDTLLFMLVPIVVVAFSVRPRPSRRAVAGALLLPLAVFAVIHWTGVVFSDRGHHSYLADIRGVFRYERNQIGLVRAAVQAFLYSFAALWVAAATGWRRGERRVRLSAWYVVPVVASIVIAADWPRVLGFAFPIVIGLSCVVPVSTVRRCVIAVSVLLDTLLLPSLSSSGVKDAAVVAAFVVGSVAAIPGVKPAATPWDEKGS